MSQNPSTVSDNDWIALLFMGVFVVAGGAASLSTLLAPVRTWMVEHRLLEQGDAIVLPLVDGVGLGIGQLLVIAAVFAVALGAGITLARRRAARR